MTPAEFVTRAVGIPWIRWRSDFAGADCYGLVVLYHREVMGVDLGDVPQTDLSTGMSLSTGWAECAPEDGATGFMSWRHGAPEHCGILLPGSMLLHSEGSPEHPGAVRLTRLAVAQRIYGEILFYKYTPCS